MPIYAYRCSRCGHAKDVLQKISDPVLTDCPACGEATFVKQVTAAGFQLKGSGWYVTDFRGGSNGGLLMGAALTQAPELFRAVVAQVGIYDMLRNELTPNGSFNTVEYGTVKEATHFRALYDYSPYHRVRDGAKYPAVLLMTGENDPRVDPLHSRKMTARLQAATASGRPVLLRSDAATGHGMGTPRDARIEEAVDIYSFLFAQLGVE